MNLEFRGTLKKGEIVKGTNNQGNPWIKQQIVISENKSEWPDSVALDAFGDDKVEDLERFKDGDDVTAYFNIQTNEYNGRIYNNVKLWKLKGHAGNNTTEQSQPQQNAPQTKPPTMIDEMDDGSDLPF